MLLYNKVGGWVSVNGQAQVKGAFSHLAAAKGFELAQLNDDSIITLDYLKQFQVIVWNNNDYGGASVPTLSARQAVVDYLEQGGGWMLIGFAGDHQNSWSDLAEVMGTSFSTFGKLGEGEVVLDSAADRNPELKWMVAGFPKAFSLNDIWMSFHKTVRPLPGITVIATSRNLPGTTGYVLQTGDGSNDQVFIWARKVGQGRFLYNAIGFGSNPTEKPLMAQADSIVPKFYWENLRYAAGDYQNGCTTPGQSGFNPAARVHDEAACSPTKALTTPSAKSGMLTVSKGGMRIRLALPQGVFRARLRNLRGVLVWERNLDAGTRELALADDLKAGLYHLEARGAEGSVYRRLALP